MSDGTNQVQRVYAFHESWTRGPAWMFFLSLQDAPVALYYDRVYNRGEQIPRYISDIFVSPLDGYLWFTVFRTYNVLLADYMVRVRAPIKLSLILKTLVNDNEILWLEWFVKQTFYELSPVHGYVIRAMPVPEIDDALLAGHETAYFCLHHWSGRPGLFRDVNSLIKKYFAKLQREGADSVARGVKTREAVREECAKQMDTLVRILVPRYTRGLHRNQFAHIVPIRSIRLIQHVLDSGEDLVHRQQCLRVVIHQCLVIDWDDGFDHFVQRLNGPPGLTENRCAVTQDHVDSMFMLNSVRCYRLVNRKYPKLSGLHVPSESAMKSAVNSGHEKIILKGCIPDEYSVTDDVFMLSLTSTPDIFDWAYSRVSRHFRIHSKHVDAVIRSVNPDLICRFFLRTSAMPMVTTENIQFLARSGCRQGLYALHRLNVSIYTDPLLRYMTSLPTRYSYVHTSTIHRPVAGVASEIVSDIFTYGKDLSVEAVQAFIAKYAVGNHVFKDCDSIRSAKEYLERMMHRRSHGNSNKIGSSSAFAQDLPSGINTSPDIRK